jgi:SAM-dependent methyltransferase
LHVALSISESAAVPASRLILFLIYYIISASGTEARMTLDLVGPMPPRDPKNRTKTVAQMRFASCRAGFEGLGLAERFDLIHRSNLWASEETVSGVGSELEATEALRRALPSLFRRYRVRSILDAACGDFRWMSQMDLSGMDYIGADIVTAMVDANASKYSGHNHIRFVHLDLLRDRLPSADLILCRDCLVHLSFAKVRSALHRFARSRGDYLLATTFPGIQQNDDIEDGDWRPINLEKAPFDLPPPIELIVEGCSEAAGDYSDKALGLWSIATFADYR